jgi:hypothetical protein
MLRFVDVTFVASEFEGAPQGILPHSHLQRNDGTFAALGRHDGAFSMNENRPYPMLVIGAAIGFAIVLMIWSMAGTSNTGTSNEANRGSAQTTGSNTSGSNPVPAPTMPRNDAGSDSARSGGPLNKSQ